MAAGSHRRDCYVPDIEFLGPRHVDTDAYVNPLTHSSPYKASSISIILEYRARTPQRQLVKGTVARTLIKGTINVWHPVENWLARTEGIHAALKKAVT